MVTGGTFAFPPRPPPPPPRPSPPRAGWVAGCVLGTCCASDREERNAAQKQIALRERENPPGCRREWDFMQLRAKLNRNGCSDFNVAARHCQPNASRSLATSMCSTALTAFRISSQHARVYGQF